MAGTTVGSRLFDAANYLFLGLVSLSMLLPFVYIIAGSFADSEQMLSQSMAFFPSKFSLEGYRYIFSTSTISWSVIVTVYITLLGTLINLVLTTLMAYALAKRQLPGKRIFMLLVLFTMLFNGGMIPTFLVVRSMGLLDTLWSLMIPNAINAFNLIVLRSFFQNIPSELEEAAQIDGCSEPGLLPRIIIPLSLPAIATFGLFYAVNHWNTFFHALMYINDADKWPIQVWLRQIVIMSSGGVGDSQSMDDGVVPPAEVIKMAVIVISTVPILMVYPFLQKHFAKGVMLGSVKG